MVFDKYTILAIKSNNMQSTMYKILIQSSLSQKESLKSVDTSIIIFNIAKYSE